MTVQGHPNIVAVSVLREMAAVVLTGGRAPDPDTVSKADQERIPILLWPGSAFELAGRLYAAGVGARPPAVDGRGTADCSGNSKPTCTSTPACRPAPIGK